jgi:predicted transcriptional regulator
VPPDSSALRAGQPAPVATDAAATAGPARDDHARHAQARDSEARSAPAQSGRDQPGRDQQAIGRFIERFAGILYQSGVPRMPARVFTALLAADAAQLSAADIAAVLGVSPAAVSGAVRYLLPLGLVTSAGEPGSRRLSYSVPDDVWERLLTARNQVMAQWAETMRDGVALLGTGTPAGARLTENARFFDFVTAELPGVLARWEQYKAGLGNPEA